jgi:hypothetical protein
MTRSTKSGLMLKIQTSCLVLGTVGNIWPPGNSQSEILPDRIDEWIFRYIFEVWARSSGGSYERKWSLEEQFHHVK